MILTAGLQQVHDNTCQGIITRPVAATLAHDDMNVHGGLL